MSICDSINSWMHTPIELKKERCKLTIIACATVAIVAFGLVCYWYVGGRYADFPGYNQVYAYFIWSVAGALGIGTAITFLVKSILSRPTANTSHLTTNRARATTTQFNTVLQSQIADRSYNNSFKQALESMEIKWLTSAIAESIIVLTPSESANCDFFEIASSSKRHGALEKMLPIFEMKNSPFLAGWYQEDEFNKRWFICARINYREQKDSPLLEGVMAILQHSHLWSISCYIDGLTIKEAQEAIGVLYFDNSYPEANGKLSWVKSILEGNKRGLIALSKKSKFEGYVEDGETEVFLVPAKPFKNL